MNYTLSNLKKINFLFHEKKDLNAIHLTNLPQSFMEEVKKFGDLTEKDILKLIKDGFCSNNYTKNQMVIATNIQRHKKEEAICNDLFGCIFKNKHDNAKYSHIPAQI